MYEVRQAGLKGLGVFAAKPIVRGTRILAERPLLSITYGQDVYAAFRQLTPQCQQDMRHLARNDLKAVSALTWAQAAWRTVGHLSAHVSSSLFDEDKGTSDWPSIGDYLAVQNIFRNNSFNVGGDVQALFIGHARINHSCVPNVQANWNGNIDRLTVHALHDLQGGEEVTLSYLAEHGAVRKVRQAQLLHVYGFTCGCSSCRLDSREAEEGELRRQALHQQLSDHAAKGTVTDAPTLVSFDEPENVAVTDFISRTTSPQDAGAKLRITTALILLFEAERLAGRELATMYLAAAKLELTLGRPKEAARCARRGLQLDRDCVGSDSPLYHHSLEAMQAMRLPHE